MLSTSISKVLLCPFCLKNIEFFHEIFCCCLKVEAASCSFLNLGVLGIAFTTFMLNWWYGYNSWLNSQWSLRHCFSTKSIQLGWNCTKIMLQWKQTRALKINNQTKFAIFAKDCFVTALEECLYEQIQHNK